MQTSLAAEYDAQLLPTLAATHVSDPDAQAARRNADYGEDFLGTGSERREATAQQTATHGQRRSSHRLKDAVVPDVLGELERRADTGADPAQQTYGGAAKDLLGCRQCARELTEQRSGLGAVGLGVQRPARGLQQTA